MGTTGGRESAVSDTEIQPGLQNSAKLTGDQLLLPACIYLGEKRCFIFKSIIIITDFQRLLKTFPFFLLLCQFYVIEIYENIVVFNISKV